MQVLCPLVNVPMIDYTLEFLARNDVREVFVFCVSHAKQLEEYLQSSTWAAHMEVWCGAVLHRFDSTYIVRATATLGYGIDVVSYR